jgi:hypothetical protein
MMPEMAYSGHGVSRLSRTNGTAAVVSFAIPPTPRLGLGEEKSLT